MDTAEGAGWAASIQLNRFILDGMETNGWAGRSARGFRHASRTCRARSARPTVGLN